MMKIFPFFPIPVAKFPNFISSSERRKMYKDIKNTTHSSHGAIKGDGVSTHFLSGTKIDGKIKDRIEEVVKEYTQTYGHRELKIGNIWSNIQNKGSILTEHSHAESMVSGALYVNVGEGSDIYFHNPNPYVSFTVPSDYDNRTVYNCEWQILNVKNSDLILFPSWLRHGKSDKMMEIDDRVVVSFNLSAS